MRVAYAAIQNIYQFIFVASLYLRKYGYCAVLWARLVINIMAHNNCYQLSFVKYSPSQGFISFTYRF